MHVQTDDNDICLDTRSKRRRAACGDSQRASPTLRARGTVLRRTHRALKQFLRARHVLRAPQVLIG
eukprot:805719-Lingulodinium_polyedra.AAC.1